MRNVPSAIGVLLLIFVAGCGSGGSKGSASLVSLKARPTRNATSDPGPLFYLSATNGGKKPVSEITFELRMMAKGHTVPLASKMFTWQISGGLEPSETKERMFEWDEMALHSEDFLETKLLVEK